MTDSVVTKPVVSVLSTSGHVLATGCVRWAPNNWIAVVTDRHILVLTPPSEPTAGQHLQYRQSSIANPDKPMTFDCGLTVKQMMDSCHDNIDQQQVIMCDPTLAGETVNSANLNRYRRVEWSAACDNWGCLLAALTLDHRLVIYGKEANNWKPLLDLTVLLNQMLKNLWAEEQTMKTDFETYKTRMYSLATFSFCWAQDWRESSGRSVCRLFMASKNGLISFWDITLGSDSGISADMVNKWQTELDQINCVKSFEDYLIVSSIRGTVCVVRTDFAADSDPDQLLLWPEEDSIPVIEFAIKSMDNNVFEVVFTKSDYVIVCRFSAEEGSAMSVIALKVVPGLHQMPSTAICPINEAKYLLTSQDGRLVELDIDDELTVQQIEVIFDGISSKTMTVHGVDSSFNGALSVMVQSLSQMYDHLVVKEPIRVIVFANISAPELSDILLTNFLAAEESDDRQISFDEYFDYLCCAQSFLSSGTSSANPANSDLTSSANFGLTSYLLSLTEMAENQSLITECIHAFKVRIIRFLFKTFIANNKDMRVKAGLESCVRLCEDTIRRLYFERVVNRLATDSSVDTLTESQCQSLKNINAWHVLRFSRPLVLNESLLTTQEFCPICSEVIAFESQVYGRCPQFHRFDRCSNSLVVLDLVRHKYQKCVRCGHSLIVRSPVWDSSRFCLFCQ